MKRFFKRTIACLIAVLMVVSSLPFTAITASAQTESTNSTIKASSYGIFKGSTVDRKYDPLQICNDAEDSNFTIGYVNFDISNVSYYGFNNEKVTAIYNFTATMATGCAENKGVTVWYPTKNVHQFTQKGSGQHILSDVNADASSNIYKGNLCGHKDLTVNYYGLQKLGDFAVDGSSKSVDIGAAIKNAKSNGKGFATICFMNTSAGIQADNGSGWTDTEISINKNEFNVNVLSESFSTNKEYVKKYISSFEAYKGFSKYTYNGKDLSAGYSDYYSNVLYDDGVFEDDTNPPYHTYGNVNCKGKLFFNRNVVLMYDGINETVLPVVASVYANNRYRFIDLIKDISTDKWILKENWRGGSCNFDEWPTSNSELPKEYTGQENFRINTDNQFRNKLKYNGEGDKTNYYELFSPTNNRINLSLGYHSTYITDYHNVHYFDIYDANSNIYVVNYEPIVNAISSMKNVYNTIQTKGEDKYCVKDLDNFYQAVYRIMTFNPNTYSYSDNTDATVKKLAEDIKNIVENTIPIATTEPKLGNHNIVYEYKDTNVHIKKCSEGDIAEIEENHTLGEDGCCTLCNGLVLDYSVYNDAVTEAESIVNDEQYTAESRAQYSAVVETAKADKKDAAMQSDIDQLVAQILSAKTLLRKTQCVITFNSLSDDATEPNLIETKTVEYGTQRNFKYTPTNGESVKAWIVTTDKGSTVTTVKTLADNFTLYVTKEAEVTVCTVSNPSTDTAKYSKVVFLGKNSRVVAVKYLEENKELPTDSVSAPNIPFYSFAGWDKPTVTGTGSDIYVTATYTPEQTTEDQMCKVYFNGFENGYKAYTYNSYVRLENTEEGKQYALAADEAGVNILTYLDDTSFFAPKTDKIYVVEVTRKEAKVAITGSFAEDVVDEKGNTMASAVFNCKFYLPTDCELIEWGAEISANGRTKVVKGDSLSSHNEYTIRMKVSKTSSIQAFTGRAYVTYKDSHGTVNTIYSDPVEQSLNK